MYFLYDSTFIVLVLCIYNLSFDFLFFFFKQKTAYEMRISDWSSDVCSSDLYSDKTFIPTIKKLFPHIKKEEDAKEKILGQAQYLLDCLEMTHRGMMAMRSEERRVGKECVSSVDLGGRRIIKKKKKKIKIHSVKKKEIKKHMTVIMILK